MLSGLCSYCCYCCFFCCCCCGFTSASFFCCYCICFCGASCLHSCSAVSSVASRQFPWCIVEWLVLLGLIGRACFCFSQLRHSLIANTGVTENASGACELVNLPIRRKLVGASLKSANESSSEGLLSLNVTIQHVM